tara:strand:+ start:182 stop:640 length:459 start_codon:yes stop_codon:yes gene_type:complete
LNVIHNYRGDIRVGREYTAVKCVGNFIRKRRKQRLVADIYIDGGTRGSRICLVDITDHKTIIKTRGGEPTNNELEYLALLYALDYINNRHKKNNVTIHSDSKLVVNQINGDWEIKTDHLIPLYNKCIKRMTDKIKIKWVRRDSNLAGIILED